MVVGVARAGSSRTPEERKAGRVGAAPAAVAIGPECAWELMLEAREDRPRIEVAELPQDAQPVG